MSREIIRHPVEVTTVGLVDGASDRAIQNDDVAFIPVTRFNVRMRIGKRNRWSNLDGVHLVESPEYNDYWRRRLDIFERVCIPSVLNLTPCPDAWFIAFGDVEPLYIQELLERLSIHPWIKPYIRKKGHPTGDTPLSELLSNHVRSLGKTYLCSTRFDSDDSLHQQFTGALDRAISQLRARGVADERRCLNFMYCLVQSGGGLSVFLRPHNMFESTFEHVDGLQGPYQGSHDEIRHRMPLVEVVTNLPMWIYHRHEDTLEPPWVTARDRLPLAHPEQYFPMFGLSPDSGAVLTGRANSNNENPDEDVGCATGDPRLQASELRDAPYWRPYQVANAVALASSQKQPELARWLMPMPDRAIDAAQMLREIESAHLVFLNGARHAQLARLLLDQGDPIGVLRAYDYAVLLAPTDRHVRAERDELAGSLVYEIDLVEQLELAGIERSGAGSSNTVVIVKSAPSIDSDPVEIEPLQERSRLVAEAGFITNVIMLPDPEHASSDPRRAAESRNGVFYEYLPLPSFIDGGADASRCEHLRLLAARGAELRPCLLVTDGTLAAQSAAAAEGRAFSIPVDFSAQSVPVAIEETG